MTDPDLASVFELRTRMEAGVTVRPDDLTLEQWDLVGVVEEEVARYRQQQQEQQEAEMRRMNRHG